MRDKPNQGVDGVGVILIDQHMSHRLHHLAVGVIHEELEHLLKPDSPRREVNVGVALVDKPSSCQSELLQLLPEPTPCLEQASISLPLPEGVLHIAVQSLLRLCPSDSSRLEVKDHAIRVEQLVLEVAV